MRLMQSEVQIEEELIHYESKLFTGTLVSTDEQGFVSKEVGVVNGRRVGNLPTLEGKDCFLRPNSDDDESDPIAPPSRNGKPFSGFLYESDEYGMIWAASEYIDGKLTERSFTWHSNGIIASIRDAGFECSWELDGGLQAYQRGHWTVSFDQRCVRAIYGRDPSEPDNVLDQVPLIACERLQLEGPAISINILSRIAKVTSVEKLHLYETNISRAGLKIICESLGLKRLLIRSNQRFSSDDAKRIADSCGVRLFDYGD